MRDGPLSFVGAAPARATLGVEALWDALRDGPAYERAIGALRADASIGARVDVTIFNPFGSRRLSADELARWIVTRAIAGAGEGGELDAAVGEALALVRDDLAAGPTRRLVTDPRVCDRTP